MVQKLKRNVFHKVNSIPHIITINSQPQPRDIIRTIKMIFIWLIILITKDLGRVEGLAPDESSNRNRDLRIGMLGTTPYFFVKDNRIMGSDMLMVQLLSEKMGFSYELNVVRTFEKLVFMVSQMLLYTLTDNICLT